jgi:pyruvate dehydrogenase E2 component (dihydrolipoamide acetyltransferase)
MATVINMPKLGFDMAEGLLVRWVKSEGDPIAKGEVLAEIETDKATVEVESEAEGVVNKHLVPENTNVPVGSAIAVIGAAGEQVDVEAVIGSQAVEETEAQAEPETVALEEPETVAAEPAPAKAVQSGADGDGRLPGGVRASPVARRLAAESGINLGQMRGSGPLGRITKQDVEAALVTAPATATPVLPVGETVRVPLSKLRATIGRRMTASKQAMPHFYVTADLDAGPLVALRKELNSRQAEDAKFSVNDFLVKAAGAALREFPNLNSSLDGDEIVRHGEVNVGVAVALDEGLITVVAKNADVKPLPQLSSELRELVSHARAGRVRPGDIEGSTFTLSNLGMFQVDHFIAIINPPETAIMAVGSVRDEPVLEDGQIVAGKRLQVTLSADHRVTDGAEVARWLQVFRQNVESPVHLLL